MNPPGREVYRTVLESLCARLGIALVLADRDGSTVWANALAHESFPGCFSDGKSFDTALAHCTIPESDQLQAEAWGESPSSGELRRVRNPRGERVIYRYSRVPLDDGGAGLGGAGLGGAGLVLHCLSNVSEEKKLKQHFIHNLQQLKIMREIVDVLYESLETQEVIYLILVAVTSQMGFGFNRAFFLHMKGNRLRGRIGIGPSNHEEAHEIWTRIASLNFSSLREVYNDLTRNGDVPDPRTQEIALSLDFDLSNVCSVTDRLQGPDVLPGGKVLPGLLGALQRGKPVRLHKSDAETPMDRSLFHLLSTDVVAVVPLLVQGRLAGVIIADNFITRKSITDADLNVLKTFAGYAGVALERSHLYDELRESVTKLQAANESLKANHQKLLQAEKLSAIGELAAYVSHEIRNPLVAIGGLARSLVKDDIKDPETLETLQIIVSEVNRLEKFLRDTLDFVKPRKALPVAVDLSQIVRDCVATFRNELARSAIQVELNLWEQPLKALMDPGLLVHALSNLIKNAIEAIGSEGKIELETRREGPTGVIRIGDTGVGIPPEVLPRIFDPFFTTKSDGTGLGLSLASENIRSLGGHLAWESHAELKTLFKLTLPLEGTSPQGSPEETTRQERRAELEAAVPADRPG